MAGPSPLDAYRLPRFPDLDPPERFDALADTLARAEREGAIAPLPGSFDEVRPEELQPSRIHTIRTRLYLLGYFRLDSRSPRIDDGLKKAITQFQTEAGLTVDGWVGKETWTALQELVSFEHPSRLEKWFSEDAVNPALLRAVKLRLFVLGFLPSKQAAAPEKLARALDKFVFTARILALTPEPLAPGLNQKTIGALFDQDRITGQLGRSGDDFLGHRPADISKKEALRVIPRFAGCCAAIELWLLGHDLALDGRGTLKVPPAGAFHVHDPEKYPLYHALYTFWQETGKDRNHAWRLAYRLTGAFFRTLTERQEKREGTSASDGSETVYQVLTTEDDATVDRVWAQIKTIGSRIWDGLKRVWRWIRRLFATAVQKTAAWVKNMARLAYQYALNAFPVARRIVEITRETAAFLLHPTLPESDTRHIVITRDRNFDFRIAVNRHGDKNRVASILAVFSEKASLFRAGIRFFGILIGTLVTVAKQVARAGGWFGLILALVKIYSQLRELTAGLDESRAFMAVV